MRNLFYSWYQLANPAKRYLLPSILFSIILLFFSTTSFSQAGDLSQIRNGDGKVKNGVLDACGDCWVNGNAGATNAHYVEGMSIAYRSLITGLTPNVCYEYEVGYDTYHGAMAIDYLTHFQRLQPHGPFGHTAEIINPLKMVSGSRQYDMTVVAGGTNTFPIKQPSPSGIQSGVFNKNGTARDVSNQALTSFNALQAAEKLMTIYNGVIQDFNYVSEAAIILGGADAETRVRIRFMAKSDSVVLAWGGHIASRLDWGYVIKQNKLVPLSAGGISGSPYHMRQKAFDKVACNVDPQFPSTLLQAFSGFGNQDRSLSAAAVFPPPECPTATSKTQCYESKTFTFAIDAPEANVTYTWSFGTNTVNAAFQGGTNTGNSVTVVANPGADVQGVDNGGSFTLNIVASLNGVTQECPGVASGTLVDVDVDALDADNAFTMNLNQTGSQALGIESISPGTTSDYNYLWKLVSQPNGGSTSFTNLTATGGATFNVLTPFAVGVYTVRVIATQKSAPNCKDSSDVTIDVSGGVNCRVNGPATVCPGSIGNVYYYDPNNDNVPDAIPADFSALWSFDGLHPSATFDGSLTGNSVKVDVAALGSSCNTSYTVKLTLTSTSLIVVQSCTKAVTVEDKQPPVITNCPEDKNLACGASTLPANTGEPVFTDNCSATAAYTDVTVENCNRKVIRRTWTVTDICGNTATCTQLIILTDNVIPNITCPANKTGATALICGASTLPANTGTATATDNCSAVGDIIIYYKDAPAINVPCGGITRTWYAVDKAGNQSSCVQTIAFAPPVVTRTSSTQLQSEPVTETKTNLNLIKNEAASSLQVKAFPNPFTNKVTFRFSSPESGRAILEVYNTMGQKLGIVFEGTVRAGIVQQVDYDAKRTNNATLIYKLRVNDKTINGKLIQLD